MISINKLSMCYGAKLLFNDFSANLQSGHRYGIVGANGSGKSTLLRIISREEEPSMGEVQIPKQASIGWMKQDQFRYEDNNIIDVVIAGKATLASALQEKELLLAQEDFDDRAGMRLGELEEIIANNDGYTAESFAHTLLTGLGIREEYHQQPLNRLSGGFKLRVLLAQALFEEPDILLLDEPTNHLDIMTIIWLEKYLIKEFQGLLLLISHDLNFLNRTVTDILDVDYGEITHYIGNYDHFVKEKQLISEQKLHARGHAEERIAQMKLFVDRFKAKASKAKQAKSKMKMIDKIELPDIQHSSRISPNFQFNPKRLSGKTVLNVKGIDKSFDSKQVLENISLQINRGEKVAIIGHNGIGKSTLLKILLNRLPADQGEFEWGYETNISYFAQDHHEMLKEPSSLLEWLAGQASVEAQNDVRKTLGKVLFSKSDVEKNVLTLSGGEAARLLLANIMLQYGNVLVLDEPTNHLDIEAIEALANALRAYTGSIILVSHDRHFVAKFATRIIALTEEGIKDFHGSYQEYLKHYGEDYLSDEWLLTQQ